MSERGTSTDGRARASDGMPAAQAAVAPWLATLPSLSAWLDHHAGVIWPEASASRGAELLALLRRTLSALARGEAATARAAAPSAGAPQRIDMLLARPRHAGAAAPRQVAPRQVEQRRRAVLDLALWQALQDLRADDVGLLHAALARAAPPALGVSPAPTYAGSAAAREFFAGPVRRVLDALARRVDAAYAQAIPVEPFDGHLPTLVAWSHAWSVAVAGVFLDHLHRHAGPSLAQARCELWSGRLGAVRFRTGYGLTALPSRAGDLHLDLWTCAVKAQALAFDAARWPAHAAGTRRHGVRIAMHEMSGLGVESLYRTVFIDRLRAVTDAAGEPPSQDDVHSVAVEVDKPRNGQMPNLRLLLRWRDPAAPLRFAAGGDESHDELLQHWLASHGQQAVALALPRERFRWQAAGPSPRFADDSGEALIALGHGALWPALDPSVQWAEPALVICIDDAWYELAVALHDEPGDEARTWWLVREREPLPPGLDASGLRQAAQCDAALHVVAHQVGLGAFVMVAIDVDAWRRTQSR